MKSLEALLFVPVLSCLLLSCESNQKAADPIDVSPSRTVNEVKSVRDVAVEHDTVWVIINHVRPGKQEVFEKFFHEVFFDSASKLDPGEQRLFRQTRILHPVTAQPDGTFSYFFIMDPKIPSGDYSIEGLLGRMYSKEDAAEHIGMYRESVINQTGYTLIQSRH